MKPVLHVAIAMAASAGIASAELITEPTRVFDVDLTIGDPQDPPMVFLQTIGDSPILSITRVEIGLHLVGTSPDNGFASDMFVSLNADFGPTSILLNRVGMSSGDPIGFFYDGWNVTFRDGAPAGDIHVWDQGTGVLTGTYEPDGRTLPFDTERLSLLEVFNGRPANGEWRLAVGDLSEGAEMKLVSWSLTFSGETVIPEPSSHALLGLGIAALALRRRSAKS
ncbi:MAG TPA: PEP-CTERM sorting domain-containing protein [Verrucomicrobiae bacterium]|nr:PEP-CTERM sorting domain-containing protein [Verrucomicrobiae bacterium]